MQKTGAQLLVDNLVLHGVRRAYCVPGESYLGVLDALYDVQDRIELIVNRQEGGACFMAEAHGKLTGEPGICFVTRGPGATNAAIGVHHAQQDSTPLILFIGQVGGDFVEREAFQEVDYRRMFGPLCKWVAQIDRADRVAEYVARAFQVTTSGRPGPVVLALPEDMLCEAVFFEPSPSGRGQGEGVGKKNTLPEPLKTYARDMRKNQTNAEALLWECLRDRRMNNQKFRRQHPIHHYILDFYCPELKLAVELDGGQHNDETNKRRDAARTDYLHSQGIRVLRFWNDEALVQTDEVLEQIWFATQSILPTPSPLPSPKGRGFKPIKTLHPHPSIAQRCGCAKHCRITRQR
jgi:very-short-patch-repair endonuclease